MRGRSADEAGRIRGGPGAPPPEPLLAFDPTQVRGPLCAFPGGEAPDEPFPHRNLNADFRESLGGEPA